MRFVAEVVALALLPISAMAQQSGRGVEPSPLVIRTSTKMVLVDVIVTDKAGQPIPNLQRDDFILEENGKIQPLATFADEHSSGMRAPKSPAVAATPDNVFTNRPTDVSAEGPLIILLLDALNTDFKDQAYARQQLLRYIDSQLQPGQRLAVFALTNQLIRLQDVTTDPTILRAAIAKYVPSQLAESSKSNSLPISTTANAALTTGSTDAMVLFQTRTSLGNGAKPSIESALANLQALDTARSAVGLEARIATTLEGFRAIARSFSLYRGRKNLIWVSSSFPFSLVPDNNSLSPNLDRTADPTAPPPLPNQTELIVMQQEIERSYTDEIRRVAAMMGDLQISIYPVDARGLMPANMNAANDAGLTANGKILFGNDFSHQLSTRGAAAYSSQLNMKELADQTGGRAFVNRNDIDNAVTIAAREGLASYTLGYYPANKKWNGSFRKIKVRVRRHGASVRHRTGYFALDSAGSARGEVNIPRAGDFQIAGVSAPIVLFDVEVSPRDHGQVGISFLVDPHTVATEPQNGRYRLALDFFVVAYDRNGQIATNTGKTVATLLEAADLKMVMEKGMMLPMEIRLPRGEYRLRLTVEDSITGHMGNVDAFAKVD